MYPLWYCLGSFLDLSHKKHAHHFHSHGILTKKKKKPKGFIFTDGLPSKTGKRYSVNSVCLNFEENKTNTTTRVLSLGQEVTQWWMDMVVSIGIGIITIFSLILGLELKYQCQKRLQILGFTLNPDRSHVDNSISEDMEFALNPLGIEDEEYYESLDGGGGGGGDGSDGSDSSEAGGGRGGSGVGLDEFTPR
eukprot:TRINITY_DN8693_c0_g1_i2.p1 TRINITY_DN8693_c0_g1~~TRINITY_DN8693_c0_g1_i2.p1  ORF type:complete len:192 (+),score=47.29 TRINITY_DN8693_c0_g1_i2:435-1010(+)